MNYLRGVVTLSWRLHWCNVFGFRETINIISFNWYSRTIRLWLNVSNLGLSFGSICIKYQNILQTQKLHQLCVIYCSIFTWTHWSVHRYNLINYRISKRNRSKCKFIFCHSSNYLIKMRHAPWAATQIFLWKPILFIQTKVFFLASINVN